MSIYFWIVIAVVSVAAFLFVCVQVWFHWINTERGIVRFWNGWCGAMDYCPFARVVGMERVDATGGASPLPYEKWVG